MELQLLYFIIILEEEKIHILCLMVHIHYKSE